MFFEYAPIALMEQDFSVIHSRLAALRAQGVRNLAAHLETHPEEIEACMAGIRILRVNRTGDKIFRRAAEVLRAAFRQEDVVARIGGDEFAIIMPETNAETAEETLTRIETLV